MACYYQSGGNIGGLGPGCVFVDGERKIDHMGKDWCPQGINQFFQDDINHLFKHRPSLSMFNRRGAEGGGGRSSNIGVEDTCVIVNTGPRPLVVENEIVAVPPICKYPRSPYVGDGLERQAVTQEEHRHTLQTFEAQQYKSDLTNVLMVVREVGDDLRSEHAAEYFHNDHADASAGEKLALLDGLEGINNLYGKAMGNNNLAGEATTAQAKALFETYMTRLKNHIHKNALYADCAEAVENTTNLDKECDKLGVFMHVVTHLARATKDLVGICNRHNDKQYTSVRLCMTNNQVEVIRAALPQDGGAGVVPVQAHMLFWKLLQQNQMTELYTLGVVSLAPAHNVNPTAACRVRNIQCKMI